MSCVKEASPAGPGPGPCPPDGYRELSTEELRELLRDEDKMEQIIRLNEKFQELQLDRENLLTSNRGLAEVSLTQRPRLHSGKLQLSHKYQELSNLATSCWEKQSRLEARGHKGSLQSAQARLQEEVGAAEEQSEELLEKFMDGLLPLDDFLDSFQRSRRSCHVRRAQAEKLQELSRRNQEKPDCEAPHRPNGLPLPQGPPPQGPPPQGPLRVFQVRYGLTPAILVPHYPPVSPPPGQAPAPPPPLPPAMGLRLIGQLPGGWASGRPVRVQQLYRPSPAHTEPPCR